MKQLPFATGIDPINQGFMPQQPQPQQQQADFAMCWAALQAINQRFIIFREMVRDLNGLREGDLIELEKAANIRLFAPKANPDAVSREEFAQAMQDMAQMIMAAVNPQPTHERTQAPTQSLEDAAMKAHLEKENAPQTNPGASIAALDANPAFPTAAEIVEKQEAAKQEKKQK